MRCGPLIAWSLSPRCLCADLEPKKPPIQILKEYADDCYTQRLVLSTKKKVLLARELKIVQKRRILLLQDPGTGPKGWDGRSLFCDPVRRAAGDVLRGTIRCGRFGAVDLQNEWAIEGQTTPVDDVMLLM